jgi:ferredoxin
VGFPFEDELRMTLQHLPNLRIDVFAKSPREGGNRFAFSHARLDAARLVSSHLFAGGARLMLCGSPVFVDRLGSQLRALGVDDARWESERFIPAGGIGFDGMPASGCTWRVKVNSELDGPFAGAANLLEWIEAAGHSAPCGCRYGACLGCSARLLAGTVEYPAGVKAPDDPTTVLLCVARPGSDVELEVQLHPEF